MLKCHVNGTLGHHRRKCLCILTSGSTADLKYFKRSFSGVIESSLGPASRISYVCLNDVAFRVSCIHLSYKIQKPYPLSLNPICVQSVDVIEEKRGSCSRSWFLNVSFPCAKSILKKNKAAANFCYLQVAIVVTQRILILRNVGSSVSFLSPHLLPNCLATTVIDKSKRYKKGLHH